MIHLAALGRLDGTRVFPAASITAETIAGTPVLHEADVDFYRELLGPLDAVGRTDLSTVLRRKIDEFERLRAWHAETGFKGGLRRLDRRHLGGILLRLARRLR